MNHYIEGRSLINGAPSMNYLDVYSGMDFIRMPHVPVMLVAFGIKCAAYGAKTLLSSPSILKEKSSPPS